MHVGLMVRVPALSLWPVDCKHAGLTPSSDQILAYVKSLVKASSESLANTQAAFSCARNSPQ